MEGCKVFSMVSTGSTVNGRLSLAEKIVNEIGLMGSLPWWLMECRGQVRLAM